MTTRYRKPPNRHDQNITCPWDIAVKPICKKNKERVLKAVGEKNQITYKG
jgi:hypothetical protein